MVGDMFDNALRRGSMRCVVNWPNCSLPRRYFPPHPRVPRSGLPRLWGPGTLATSAPAPRTSALRHLPEHSTAGNPDQRRDKGITPSTTRRATTTGRRIRLGEPNHPASSHSLSSVRACPVADTPPPRPPPNTRAIPVRPPTKSAPPVQPAERGHGGQEIRRPRRGDRVSGWLHARGILSDENSPEEGGATRPTVVTSRACPQCPLLRAAANMASVPCRCGHN